MTKPTVTPLTEAGRRLLANMVRANGRRIGLDQQVIVETLPDEWRAVILAIEAEARDAARTDSLDVVYAVKFSNYDPAEIDSLWRDQAKAEARAEELNTKADGWGWDAVAWRLSDD